MNIFKRWDSERVLLAAAGPVIALVVAFALTSIVLAASGENPFEPFSIMFEQATFSDVQVLIINDAAGLYIGALAVAVGFRMNLFNIGVEGQYRLAACVTAIVGAHIAFPAFLQIPLLILSAAVTGAIWSGIAGVLKVTRGVSEVVSTIMLNSIAASVISYLTLEDAFGVAVGNNRTTGEMDKAGWFPGIDMGEGVGTIYGFVIVGVALGVIYWLMLNRTRFGFDLRASGASESAAAASGVSAKKMVLTAMLLSGAIAGLAGLPTLLGSTHTFSDSFPASLGFNAITVALLGRNSPAGMALASLLLSWLFNAADPLDLQGYSSEIATIMQGLIVIAVVVSYESVRVWGTRRQQQRVGAELAAGHVLGTTDSDSDDTNDTKKEVAAR
ncbi:ABC transporter permease [Streptomyces longispororuber]|uniref:ABC transporter permease n=1 Tax=Streptomyces longispororuber TaxID=68230 RepID=UPI00210AB901|nr:ABC transporter permease [Streptomyces longispororuber]MCQ4210441.1 ABC transporter permease [Streptomyces longispororuber]